MPPQQRAQPGQPEPAQHEPQLQGAKTPAERDLPVAVVDDGAGGRCLVAQIRRADFKGSGQRAAIGDIQTAAIEVRQQPLVRIEAVAVGEFEAGKQGATFRQQRGAAGHRGVDVQPQALLAADAADGRQRVAGQRRGGADSRADERRRMAGRAIGFNLRRECVRIQREVRVDRNLAQLPSADPRDHHRLVERGMGLARAIHRESASIAVFVAITAGRAFAGSEQRAEHGARRRILQDATAVAGRQKACRQFASLREPVEHMGFELGAGRAGQPQHALHAERRGQQFRFHRRRGCVGGKVGEEIRGLPVGQRRHHDAIEIGEQRIERFGGLGRHRRQGRAHCTGAHLRQHGQIRQAGVVVGDPGAKLREFALKLAGVEGHRHGLIHRRYPRAP